MLADLWDNLEPLLESYGLWVVGGSVFVESFGAPVPAESVLVAASLLASQGKLQIIPLLLCAWVASVAGDNVGYCIGRYGGRRLILRYGHLAFITEERLVQVETFFARYGGYVVLFARLFAVLRQFNGIVAGTSRMPWLRFTLFNTIGAALWVGLWGGGSYFLGQRITPLLAEIEAVEPYIVMGGMVILVTVVWVVLRFVYRRRKKTKAQATTVEKADVNSAPEVQAGAKAGTARPTSARSDQSETP